MWDGQAKKSRRIGMWGFFLLFFPHTSLYLSLMAVLGETVGARKVASTALRFFLLRKREFQQGSRALHRHNHQRDQGEDGEDGENGENGEKPSTSWTLAAQGPGQGSTHTMCNLMFDGKHRRATSLHCNEWSPSDIVLTVC